MRLSAGGILFYTGNYGIVLTSRRRSPPLLSSLPLKDLRGVELIKSIPALHIECCFYSVTRSDS